MPFFDIFYNNYFIRKIGQKKYSIEDLLLNVLRTFLICFVVKIKVPLDNLRNSGYILNENDYHCQ